MASQATPTRALSLSAILPKAILVALALLLLTPLVVTTDTMRPAITGKSVFSHSLIEIMVALWLVLLLVDSRYRPRRSLVLLALAAYVLAALLSAGVGVSFTRSFWSTYVRMMGVWDLAHWAALVLVVTSVVRTERTWLAVLNLNLGVVAFAGLLALAQSLQIRALMNVFHLPASCRLDATLGNPSYLAAILVVSTMLALGLLGRSLAQPAGTEQGFARAPWWGRRAGTTLSRALYMLVAVLGVWVLLQTGTRGALIGLVAGFIAMVAGAFIGGNRRALGYTVVAAGAALALVGLLALLDVTVGLPTGRGCGDPAGAPVVASTRLAATGPEESGFATRLMSAQAALGAFLQRPLLGWGPENYEAAFNRFVQPALFDKIGAAVIFDQAHNKPLEELVTKGALGGITFLLLWGALGGAILRGRSAAPSAVLACAVLGALAGYFVQNLFLFDTPAMMLQWSLLVAWVVAQERRGREAYHLERGGGREGSDGPREGRRPALHGRPGARWRRAGAALGVLALLGVSLYALNYRPYASARWFLAAFRTEATLADRLRSVRGSIGEFPPLANRHRIEAIYWLRKQWPGLSPTEKKDAAAFVAEQVLDGLRSEPWSYELQASAVSLLQTDADAGRLALVEPLLQGLEYLGPHRPETHALRARQELLQGHSEGALRVIEAYVERAPGMASYFAVLKQEAEKANAASGNQGSR